ncbi:hypothetical protein [Psittacicella hinzii]|uniref:hypothetical protein n=1 Tax=Psittacicella hinzii TaxID=2028575 RepID=UPI001CA631AA|nr:hypothetical protein [Psittacicella hinzii]
MFLIELEHNPHYDYSIKFNGSYYEVTPHAKLTKKGLSEEVIDSLFQDFLFSSKINEIEELSNANNEDAFDFNRLFFVVNNMVEKHFIQSVG